MKKFLNSKYGELTAFGAASVLNLIFTVIYYSMHLINQPASMVEDTSPSLWTAKRIYASPYIVNGINTYLIIAFVIGLSLTIAGIALLLFKRKKSLLYASFSFNGVLSLVVLFLGIFIHVISGGAIACAIVSILISAAALVLLILRREVKIADSEEEKTEPHDTEIKPVSAKASRICKIAMLICETIATVAMFSVMFVPLYSDTVNGKKISYVLVSSLSGNSAYSLALHIVFLVLFVACFVGLMLYVATLAYLRSDKAFARKSKSFVFGATYFALAFFIIGYCFTFARNLATASSSGTVNNANASTVSYIPFIISVITLIVYSVFYGKSGAESEFDGKSLNNTKLKAEPLIYVTVLTVITFASLLLKIVTIKFELSSLTLKDVSLSGRELLNAYADLEGGFQIMAFALFAMLLTSLMLLILSAISFIAKNKDYYKVIKTTSVANLVFSVLIGLFGVYFKIAQKINDENIQSLIQYFNEINKLIPGGHVYDISYQYTVSSQTFYMLIASVLVIAVMIARKQFNLTVQEPLKVELDEMPQTAPNNDIAPSAAATEANGLPSAYEETKTAADFDACPAFTELDAKAEQFEEEAARRRENLFTNPTLPNLVRFVVDYARECRLHLSYSLEDMATFVAGLGASRLAILQGMSGTGKTSLPKIFTEAVMGNCEIVEVESSWRDKNELLGYYNEFSKCYTPKKFTQCLYKAKLNPETLTFIVLDEMNLSRIEYYFSDFLSLMENEEDKREIKLLNIKLFRTQNGEQIPYRALTDGHTIKIPTNVWFVGTANRDESTFAISDKVYDRAQTMNFDKRAPKIHSFSEPLPQKFVPYEMITQLFTDAKKNGVFEAEDDALIQKTEKLLAPYNISFGNRILKQMEDFVKIYCACFGDKDAVVKEAVEKILLSKVVSKLENKIVENKDVLAAEFDKLGLTACGAFVRKLNED